MVDQIKMTKRKCSLTDRLRKGKKLLILIIRINSMISNGIKHSSDEAK